jgi:putative membrane protein
MRAFSIVTTIAAIVLGLVASAPAQTLSDQDREFVRKAASGDLAEIELGRLAMQRATTPSVRAFASQIVNDHSRSHAEFMALMQGRGVAVVPGLDASQQAMRDRLASLPGPDFDRAYLQEMLRDHTQDVAEFERASQILTDPDLQAWAARTLPTLQQHLALARQVNTQIVLGPAAPAALPAAVVTPWCAGTYAPAGGSNFGSCK